MEVGEYYGEDNQLGIDIWRRKYQNDGESFDNWLDRVSNGDDELRQLIKDKKFMFGGRILANRGVEGRNISMFNCYNGNVEEDSIIGIYKTLAQLALTFARGGGEGTDLSVIAPRGAIINNAAETTTGAVSFIPLFDSTCDLIGAGSRRAALLLSLISEHPDLEEFIDVKMQEGAVLKANLSVKFSDEFFKHVIANEPHTLRFVRHNGHVTEKIIDTRKVFKRFCFNNWDSSEPGALFWDTVQRWNLQSENDKFVITGVNACVPKGEHVLTSGGFKRIEDIVDEIYLNGETYKSTPMFPTGVKEVFEVTLTNNVSIRVTGNHPISVPEGSDVNLEDLSVGDHVLMDYTSVYSTDIIDEDEYNKGIIAGWFVADGGYVHKRNTTYDAMFSVGVNEFEYLEELEELISRYVTPDFEFRNHHQKPKTCKVGRLGNRQSVNIMSHDILGTTIDNDKFSIDFTSKTKEWKLGFLRAVFTCDGTSRGNDVAMLCSINKSFMYDIQRMLIEFGVYTNVSLHNNAKITVMSDGESINHKTVWKVSVYDDAFEDIGFLTEYKNDTLVTTGSKRIQTYKHKLRIKSIKSLGEMEVFDITVDDIHHFNINGVVVSNCSEVNLAQHAACLLASVNLAELSVGTELDYIELDRITRIGIRALDKIIDEGMESHALDEQKEAAAKYRQLGLGFMGLADILIKMGITYGSDEAEEVISKIGHVMINAAAQESAYIAKVAGVFDAYDFNATPKSEFFKQNLTSETKDIVMKYGLRHASLLAIAPTGTISTMLDVSGGAEPMYALKYTRKTQSLHNEDVYYEVYPKIVREYMEEQSLDSTDKLPEQFITAKQITPSNRIRMQSALQRYVDNSISSTLNLPFDATPEDVYDIYINAWESKLKGVTIHREGNRREGVLTEGTTTTTPTGLARGDWALIPSDTLHYKHKIHTGCGELHLFIGFSRTSNKIEELWIKRSNGGGCERSLDSILITMSAILRLGGNVNNIEKALRGVGTCTSFAVARAKGKKLSRGGNCAIAMLNTIKAFNVDTYTGESKAEFIQTTLPVISRPQCAECGADLVFEGGCAICKNCGYSKCS